MQQELAKGYLSYRGRSWTVAKRFKKSAEVEVLCGIRAYHPKIKGQRKEVSQTKEGPNIGLFANSGRNAFIAYSPRKRQQIEE